MYIKLWKNFSKRINSTKIPDEGYKTVDVQLKAPTNLLNPSFLLSIDNADYNYVEVPEWGRKYYVHDVTFGNNNLCELHCTFDPLGTYRSSINLYTAFVERTSHPSYYNTDLSNGAISVEDVVEHTSSASTYCHIASGLLYVVRVMGRGSTNGVGSFLMNQSQFNNIFSQLWGEVDSASFTGTVKQFAQLYASNPAQYIVGVYTTPLGASVYANHLTPSTLYMGGHQTDATLDRINTGQVKVATGLVLNKPSSIYSDFRKTDGAFSQYSIYIPTIGNCPLSADVMDKTLTMDISADLFSGDLLFILKAGGTQIASYNSNCYSSVSIGTLNQATSLVSGATQSGMSVLSKNPIGAIEGIRSAFSATPSIIGTQGGTGCVAQSNEIVISCLQKTSAESPNNVVGTPTCKNIQLINLRGHYVQCGNASVDIKGNDTDKSRVNEALNNGVYIE